MKFGPQGLTAFALLAVVGCGGADYELAPVTGQIKLDGQALPNATVTFSPTGGASVQSPPSVGTTDAEGRFKLYTAEGEEGAAPGDHAVRVTNNPTVAPGESLPDDRSLWKKEDHPLPERYNAKTELKFSVPKEGSDAANFDLQSK